MRTRERQIGAKVNEKTRIGTIMIRQTTFVKEVPRNSKLKTPAKTPDTKKTEVDLRNKQVQKTYSK